MDLNPDEVRSAIRAKILQLAANLGQDAGKLEDDELITASGFLDSVAIVELVVWYEIEYDLHLEQSEINIDNLGSANAMVDYLILRKQG